VEDEAREIVRNVVAEDVQTYERLQRLELLEEEMETAAKNLQFEKAIVLRDEIKRLKAQKHGN